jgi:hypothetical protein
MFAGRVSLFVPSNTTFDTGHVDDDHRHCEFLGHPPSPSRRASAPHRQVRRHECAVASKQFLIHRCRIGLVEISTLDGK